MLWPGLTEIGALSSMLFGLVFGVVKISLDVAYPAPHCGVVDDRPGFVKIHFMYYGMSHVLYSSLPADLSTTVALNMIFQAQNSKSSLMSNL